MNENNGPECKISFNNVFTETRTKKKDNKHTNPDLREKNQNHMQTNANARRGYGEKELSYTVDGNVNWYTHHKEQHGVFSNNNNNNNNSRKITPGHISRKNENSNLKRYMHRNVHSSTLYNSQDMEAT